MFTYSKGGRRMYGNEIDLARKSSREYFDREYEKLTFDTSLDDIVKVIALLHLTSGLGEQDAFKKLSAYLFTFNDFEKDLKANYFYSIAAGIQYRHLELYDKSRDYFNQANKISYLLDDSRLISRSLMLLSSVYVYMEDYDTALHYVHLALKSLEGVKDHKLLGDINMTLGAIFGYLSKMDEMEQAFQASYANYKEVVGIEEHSNFVALMINLGAYYTNTKDYDTAEKYLIEAKEIAINKSYKIYIHSVEKYIAELYEAQADYKKAYEAMKRHYVGLKALDEKIQKFEDSHNANELMDEINSISKLKEYDNSLTNRVNNLYTQFHALAKESTFKHTLINDIAQAIKNNELVPYFQPKWSVDKEVVSGAEALIRWVKSDGTVVSPNAFITHIENHPIINDVTRLVIDKSIELVKVMTEMGYKNFDVSINLSPYQIHNPLFVNYLKKKLEQTHVNPASIEFEITERSYLDKGPEALRTIYDLKEMGHKLSLDDFGSGYSSLSSVSELPFDIVKIDRSLIIKILEYDRTRKMLIGLTRLMKELGLVIIAEGVETLEQVDLLKSIGCDGIQGYYYGMPIPLEEFINM
jgi:EAL domain-containing protein (putative c-di-GMP-specific phosphodiesterase class I)